MIIEHLVGKLPTKSGFTKLMAGSVLTALAISLGMVGILRLLDFTVNPALPATLGAVGAAVFVARMRK